MPRLSVCEPACAAAHVQLPCSALPLGDADERPSVVCSILGRIVPSAVARRLGLARPSGGRDGMAACSSIRRRPARATASPSSPPAFAAPAVGPAIHEQAMRRLADLTGLEPVEYPTTRRLGATSEDRAADLNAAFADPSIRAVVATIGGDDQITVIPHLDAELDPARPEAVRRLQRQHEPARLAVATRGRVVLRRLDAGASRLGPAGRSRAGGVAAGVAARRRRPRAHRARRVRRTSASTGPIPGRSPTVASVGPTEPWTWAGPATSVTGATWGGCLEAIQWILTAGRGPADPGALDGGVLLVETSEELMPALEVGRILREPRRTRLPRRGERRARRTPAGIELRRAPDAGRAGRASRAAARHRDRGDRPLQPRSRGLRRRAVRPHPPAVDRAARWRGHARRRRCSGSGPTTAEPDAQTERMSRRSGSTRRRASAVAPASAAELRDDVRRNERFRILKLRNGLIRRDSATAPHTLIDMLQ